MESFSKRKLVSLLDVCPTVFGYSPLLKFHRYRFQLVTKQAPLNCGDSLLFFFAYQGKLVPPRALLLSKVDRKYLNKRQAKYRTFVFGNYLMTIVIKLRVLIYIFPNFLIICVKDMWAIFMSYNTVNIFTI